MVKNIIVNPRLKKKLEKLADKKTKERIKKKILEIATRPQLGKPLRFSLRGDRVVRIPPFRLIYSVKGDTLYLHGFSHRKHAYSKAA
ncbi:type II toxin-antitoxin system RelE/ParE family toxin [archaeon]